MRTGTLLLLLAAVLAGCTKAPADATVSTAETAATSSADERSAAEKAAAAGLRARDKAEELKRDADAKAKEADATNE
jgi:hypothetical protein